MMSKTANHNKYNVVCVCVCVFWNAFVTNRMTTAFCRTEIMRQPNRMGKV